MWDYHLGERENVTGGRGLDASSAPGGNQTDDERHE